MQELLSALQSVPALLLTAQYQAQAAVDLSPFAGYVLHGGLGHLYRQRVCHDLKLDCSLCPKQRDCSFPPLFGPDLDVALNADRARPFVLVFHEKPPQHLQEGQRWTVQALLLGQAPEVTPRIFDAFEALGKAGLGPHRAPCRLLDATAREIKLASAAAISGASQPFSIHLTTPLRCKVQGRWTAPESMEAWTRLACRRAISVTKTFLGREPNREMLRETLVQATLVPTSGVRMRLVTGLARRSFSTGQKMDCAGMMGSISFGAGSQNFATLLQAVQPLGLGKLTSLGFGQFAIEA